MSQPLPELNPALRCPLCGGSNGCSMAAAQDPANCWCMRTPIAPRQLARIAPDQRGQRCICPACGAAAITESSPTRHQMD